MAAGTTGPNVVDQCCLHAAMESQVSIPLSAVACTGTSAWHSVTTTAVCSCGQHQL